MKHARSSLVPALALCLCSCLPELQNGPFVPGDLRPAGITSWLCRSPREVSVLFDEAVSSNAADFAVSGSFGADALALEAVGPGTTEGELCLILGVEPAPGAPFTVAGMVLDAAGNATSFVLPFWGHNPEPAGLLISEVISEGSATHPDLVEFFVREAGDLAGLSFFVGTQADHDLRYVFPRVRVQAGDFIVLHLKPQGLSTEIDETGAADASGGIDAQPTARDFWFRDGAGAIPGKNGVLTLCVSPMGSLVDAFLYSDRTSESDQKYGGFGSTAFRNRVAGIVAAGGWLAEGEQPSPEDCFSSTGTTSTRSMCRSSDEADGDSRVDWHIVPTKGASPGQANSDERYQP